MIAQQELQTLLNLPEQEKLLLAHRLLESVVVKTNGQPTTAEAQSVADTAEPSDELSPSAKWLLSMAGMYSGGPRDTGERADEICAAEIKRRSGFTLKEELP
ncbi:MAG: hypothetical protein HYR56_04440 [Acidobacteria bacterium]|nr:hypothetical protein [Acidobacteriota bacterium]MBI3421718.1 hypothetical protein [Acidobacteriota bacterium]